MVFKHEVFFSSEGWGQRFSRRPSGEGGQGRAGLEAGSSLTRTPPPEVKGLVKRRDKTCIRRLLQQEGQKKGEVGHQYKSARRGTGLASSLLAAPTNGVAIFLPLGGVHSGGRIPSPPAECTIAVIHSPLTQEIPHK